MVVLALSLVMPVGFGIDEAIQLMRQSQGLPGVRAPESSPGLSTSVIPPGNGERRSCRSIFAAGSPQRFQIPSRWLCRPAAACAWQEGKMWKHQPAGFVDGRAAATSCTPTSRF